MATARRSWSVLSLTSIYLSGILLLHCGVAQLAQANDAINLVNEARDLSRYGLHEEALARLDQAIDSLPANRRLFAWRLKYSRYVCKEVLVGGNHAYLLFDFHLFDKPTIRHRDVQPLINDMPADPRYDFNAFIVCIDLATGRPLWNRETTGRMMWDVHPRSGDVYLWRKRIFKLAAATGKTEADIEIPPGSEQLRAVADQQQLMSPASLSDIDRWEDFYEGENLTRQKLVYRFSSKKFEKTALDLERVMSPDEKYLLYGTGHSRKIRCESLPDRRLLWQIEAPELFHHVWHDGDLLVAQGKYEQPGTIARIDPATQEERWRQPIPGGIYDTRHLLIGGRSNRSDWPSLTIFRDQVIAIDGDGKLLILALDSGKIIAQGAPSDVHMVTPQVVGGNLVALSQTKAVAVPLDMMLDRESLSERELLLWQGQLYEEVGRFAEAEMIYRKLTESDPLFSNGWIARALLGINEPSEEPRKNNGS